MNCRVVKIIPVLIAPVGVQQLSNNIAYLCAKDFLLRTKEGADWNQVLPPLIRPSLILQCKVRGNCDLGRFIPGVNDFILSFLLYGEGILNLVVEIMKLKILNDVLNDDDPLVRSVSRPGKLIVTFLEMLAESSNTGRIKLSD